MDDDLRKLPEFIKLSKKTFRLHVENIVIAHFDQAYLLCSDACRHDHVDGGICGYRYLSHCCGERIKNASLERLSQLAKINNNSRLSEILQYYLAEAGL